MKLVTRLSVVVLLQVGVAVALILAFSGTPMGAQEAGIPPNAQPLAQIQSEPAPAPIAPSVAAPEGTQLAGAFTGSGPFRVTGGAVVIEGELDNRFLSFSEGFRTNRGQELIVVLRSDSGQAISLGNLVAIQGPQVYAIPDLTNLAEFDTVQIWDVQANIDFGSAVLAPL